MERKLASIQIIKDLQVIEGADKIVKATILGWEVVVLKDDFNIGDLCVYCEIDSILPDKPEFAFLKERKFRIRTIKLKGQVSQGICFPVSILPKGKYKEGDNVTEILNIKKYDPQSEAEQKEIDRLNAIHKNRIRKYFMRFSWIRRLIFRPARLPRPSFIRKTDEDRIQLFPDICKEQKGTEFYATEKLDGTSASYFLIKKGFRYKYGICSRNYQILKRDNLYWSISDKLNIKDILINLVRYHKAELVYIQGEIIGPKVQENKYHFSGLELYVFNLKIDHKWYFYSPDIASELSSRLKVVPTLKIDYVLPDTISQAVEAAKGKSLFADIPREGIVLRNNRLSFKIINPDFLLKYEE